MLNILKKREYQPLIYGMIEKVIDIIISMITGVVVVRCLSRQEYGIISTVASYAFVFSLINICPENYFFKVYSKIKGKKINEYFTSYLFFDIIDGFIIMILYIIIGIILTISNSNMGFLVIAVSSGVTLLINQVYNISRIILELRYDQKDITKLSTLTRIVRLVLTLILLITPNLYIIALRDIVSALLQSYIIFYMVKDRLKLKIGEFNIKKVIIDAKESLVKFSFLSHITGVLTGLIYNIDPIILGWFTSISMVGTYSIALNSTNYFIYIFQVIQKSSMIALGNAKDEYDENYITSKFTYLSVALGIIQFIGFLLLGRYYMLLYVDKIEVEQVYSYAFWILLGLTVFNSLRPISSYLIIKYDIKKYFKYSIIPTFIFTMILYVISAKVYGAIGMAISNFIAYTFWAITQLILLNRSKFKFIPISKKEI